MHVTHSVPRFKADVKNHVYRYLRNHPDGLTTNAMWSWVRRYVAGYTLQEFEQGLRDMQKMGSIACANKVWYARQC